MHLPPNTPPEPEPNFGKVRFGLILIATLGAFFWLFVTSNSASLRVDATDEAERDRQLSSLLKAREKFQQELQPEKEEIKSEPAPEPPQEIFAKLQPVPQLNLQTTSPLNLSEIRGNSQTNISPVDEEVDEEIAPVDETEPVDLATDFLTDETDDLTDFAEDFLTDETDNLTDFAENFPTDETETLPLDKNLEIEPTKTETNPLEYWNLPPRNSAADLLASGRITESEVLETSPENQPTSAILLTLNDAILLALENNRELKNQYLERIIQRNQLEVAEDIFAPDFTPRASLGIDGNDTNLLPFPNSGGLNLSTTVGLRLPNGATIDLTWNANSTLDGGDTSLSNLGQNLELNVTQPLLRGAGSEINRLPIKRARLTEKNNILELKSNLINTITRVITAYRSFVQSQQGLEIQENALEDAKQRLEEINILIEFGRRARVEAVPFQQDIARSELAVLRAKSNLETQKLNLIEILDLERDFEVVGEDIQEVEAPAFNLEEITELALLNKPSYLQAEINIKTAEFSLLEAEDALRWQLDLGASYKNTLDTLNETAGDLRASISLSQEFGDLKDKKLELKRSQIGLVQAQNNLLEARQNLEIEVANAVRDVKLSLEEVKLARQTTELAEQQLQIERDKLELSAPNASAQEVVRAQQAVVEARNNELAAKIDYQNSLTDLWQTLGTTLNELDIEFNHGLGEVIFEED